LGESECRERSGEEESECESVHKPYLRTDVEFVSLVAGSRFCQSPIV
jgi:hypothetical protein